MNFKINSFIKHKILNMQSSIKVTSIKIQIHHPNSFVRDRTEVCSSEQFASESINFWKDYEGLISPNIKISMVNILFIRKEKIMAIISKRGINSFKAKFT